MKTKWSFGNDRTRRNVVYLIYSLLAIHILLSTMLYLSDVISVRVLIIRIGYILSFAVFYFVLVFLLGFRCQTLIWFAGAAFFLSFTIPTILLGGDPLYFYVVLAHLIVNLFYFEYKGFLKCLLICGLPMLILTMVFQFPMMGSEIPFYMNYICFFGFLMIGLLFCYLSYFFVRNLVEIEKSGLTFNSLMGTSFSFLVIINDDAEVEYLSDSLLNWLNVNDITHLKGMPLLDVLPMGEIRMLFHEIMEQDGFVERQFSITMHNVKNYYLVRSSQLSKGKIARLFEWTDITHVMEVKNQAESAVKNEGETIL